MQDLFFPPLFEKFSRCWNDLTKIYAGGGGRKEGSYRTCVLVSLLDNDLLKVCVFSYSSSNSVYEMKDSSGASAPAHIWLRQVLEM